MLAFHGGLSWAQIFGNHFVSGRMQYLEIIEQFFIPNILVLVNFTELFSSINKYTIVNILWFVCVVVA